MIETYSGLNPIITMIYAQRNVYCRSVMLYHCLYSSLHLLSAFVKLHIFPNASSIIKPAMSRNRHGLDLTSWQLHVAHYYILMSIVNGEIISILNLCPGYVHARMISPFYHNSGKLRQGICFTFTIFWIM